jgi:voltage-gated potassium channel
MHNSLVTAIRTFVEKRKYEILLLSLLVFMLGMRPTFISPYLPIQVMIVGAIIFHNRKFLLYLIGGLLIFTIAIRTFPQILPIESIRNHSLLDLAFITYFAAITIEVFRRIIVVDKVSPEIISAVLCGFMMLSFMGWFLFDVIETYTPGSFSGLGTGERKFNNLLYFSVSNMLTLGLGDILPITLLARKAVMLMGFVGHFYTVFVTGIVIGKYINQIER